MIREHRRQRKRVKKRKVNTYQSVRQLDVAIAATAPSTKTTTSWYFFLALPVIIGYMHSSPNVVYFGGYMLACLYARSVVRTRTLLLMESPFLSPPYCAAHLFLFYFNPFQCIVAVVEASRMQDQITCVCVCVWRSKQTNGEKREKKIRRFFLLSCSLSLSRFLIFSKYNIRSGHMSFVSHSLAHIFTSIDDDDHRVLCLFLCLSPLFLVRLVVIE